MCRDSYFNSRALQRPFCVLYVTHKMKETFYSEQRSRQSRGGEKGSIRAVFHWNGTELEHRSFSCDWKCMGEKKSPILQTLRSTEPCTLSSQENHVSHFKGIGKLSSVNAKKLGPWVEREGHLNFFSKKQSIFSSHHECLASSGGSFHLRLSKSKTKFIRMIVRL